MLLILALWPFVQLGLYGRSLLDPDPLSSFTLGLLITVAVTLACLLYPLAGMRRGLLAPWWYASAASVLLMPVVVLAEGGKRGWFRAKRRRRSRAQRRLDESDYW